MKHLFQLIFSLKELRTLHKIIRGIVFEDKGKIIGYAYASKWKERSAYKNTVQVSIYLDEKNKSKGIGTLLYQHLFDRLKEMSIHVLIAGISLPNEASVAIHEKFGFEKIAHFKEIGYKFNRWIDVEYWQRILNK